MQYPKNAMQISFDLSDLHGCEPWLRGPTYANEASVTLIGSISIRTDPSSGKALFNQIDGSESNPSE